MCTCGRLSRYRSPLTYSHISKAYIYVYVHVWRVYRKHFDQSYLQWSSTVLFDRSYLHLSFPIPAVTFHFFSSFQIFYFLPFFILIFHISFANGHWFLPFLSHYSSCRFHFTLRCFLSSDFFAVICPSSSHVCPSFLSYFLPSLPFDCFVVVSFSFP